MEVTDYGKNASLINAEAGRELAKVFFEIDEDIETSDEPGEEEVD
jgi:hypothetical protein